MTDVDGDGIVTRAEQPDPEPTWLERSRKALTAGVAATAGSLSLGIVSVTGDGIWTWEETLPILIIAAGIGLSVGFATWQMPNAR